MTCTVCRSPHVAEVDKALANGDPERSIADRYGLKRTSVHRHREHAAALDSRAKEMAVTAMEHASWHLENLRAIAEKCLPIPRDYLFASREFARAAELLGRFTGQLQSPTVQAWILQVGARDESEVRRGLELLRGQGEVSLEAAREDALALVKMALAQDPGWGEAVRVAIGSMSFAEVIETNGHNGGSNGVE